MTHSNNYVYSGKKILTNIIQMFVRKNYLAAPCIYSYPKKYDLKSFPYLSLCSTIQRAINNIIHLIHLCNQSASKQK